MALPTLKVYGGNDCTTPLALPPDDTGVLTGVAVGVGVGSAANTVVATTTSMKRMTATNRLMSSPLVFGRDAPHLLSVDLGLDPEDAVAPPPVEYTTLFNGVDCYHRVQLLCRNSFIDGIYDGRFPVAKHYNKGTEVS